jgi:diguanylate cyclase (GGDEF)-like protein
MDDAQKIEKLQLTIEIAAQAKALLEKVEERLAFAREVLGLLAKHLPYQYALLQLNGPTGASYTLHARDAWPEAPPHELWAQLQIPELPAPRFDLLRDGVSHIAPATLQEQKKIPLEMSSQTLGELRLFGGAPLSEDSLFVVELLAKEISFVARVVFLLEEARRITRIDPVTGLLTRRAFIEKLEEEFERAQRYEGPVSLLLCDFVQLRLRSERVGFMPGDRLVRYAARLAEQGLRKLDFLARWSDNEFALLLTNTPQIGAKIVADRTLHSLINAWTLEPPAPLISIGLASYEGDRTVDSLVNRAERALLRAKRQGKSKYEIEPAG